MEKTFEHFSTLENYLTSFVFFSMDSQHLKKLLSVLRLRQQFCWFDSGYNANKRKHKYLKRFDIAKIHKRFVNHDLRSVFGLREMRIYGQTSFSTSRLVTQTVSNEQTYLKLVDNCHEYSLHVSAVLGGGNHSVGKNLHHDVLDDGQEDEDKTGEGPDVGGRRVGDRWNYIANSSSERRRRQEGRNADENTRHRVGGVQPERDPRKDDDEGARNVELDHVIAGVSTEYHGHSETWKRTCYWDRRTWLKRGLLLMY